ncbi:hypothetical protein [Paenibacillus tarimensis]|uniref:hypothetical protein n=1 Tax=Paenibacillus tarimensis TaxID=416012 RepID=UPI001F232442|nr:hypothetical protein [Paenibacillus tarimensis]MCF2945002.1 hypothetical protein [Paenibacillus tarimensis]
MEWNFVFRVDHLNKTGEERNLKGLLFTDDKNPPSAEAILTFLKDCGYDVRVKDAEQLIFQDENPDNPVEIRIVKLGNEEEMHSDTALRYLAEQFRRPGPQIGG